MIVYSIRNLTNGKEYVGLTTRSLEDRWKQHIYESNKVGSWEYETPLGRAIKKYGAECFEVAVLKHCVSQQDLKESEIYLIEDRRTHVSVGGYNVTKGGDGRLGAKHSDEAKAKIGRAHKGKTISIESRLKMSKSKIGVYSLGNHRSAAEIVVNGKEKFSCIKEFTNKYRLKYSSVVSSLNRNNGKTSFKDFLIERI